MEYFYVMQHCGSLIDSLHKAKCVPERVFYALMPNYRFYAYDDRLGAYRYILIDPAGLTEKNLTFWLLRAEGHPLMYKGREYGNK